MRRARSRHAGAADFVAQLRGRGMAIAFLDVLFSCIGMFVTVIALQTAATRIQDPPVGADAYFGMLADGSVLQATPKGVQQIVHFATALRRLLEARESAYPRVEVLFSGAAIDHKRWLDSEQERVVIETKPPRLIEINWRPIGDDGEVREVLDGIARKMGAKAIGGAQ